MQSGCYEQHVHVHTCTAKEAVSPAPSSGTTFWSNSSWQQDSGNWNSWWGNWGHQGEWWGNGYNYWNRYEQQEEPKPGSQASLLNSLLQRGQTVDQLSEEELHKVVKDIDALRNKRHADNKTAKDAQAKEQEPATLAPAEKPEAEEKREETPNEDQIQQQQAQAKAERKKKMHARNMRFYRSFTSYWNAQFHVHFASL